MGEKSRGNWPVGFCKWWDRCHNYDRKCGECLRYNQYIGGTPEPTPEEPPSDV